MDHQCCGLAGMHTHGQKSDIHCNCSISSCCPRKRRSTLKLLHMSGQLATSTKPWTELRPTMRPQADRRHTTIIAPTHLFRCIRTCPEVRTQLARHQAATKRRSPLPSEQRAHRGMLDCLRTQHSEPQQQGCQATTRWHTNKRRRHTNTNARG